MNAAGMPQMSPVSFVLRYWRGDGPLWKIFWIYGVLLSLAISGLYAAALYADAVSYQQVLLPVLLAYTVWIVVAVWRCAPNTGQEVYRYLARGLTIAWAINVVLIALALQLELVSTYVH